MIKTAGGAIENEIMSKKELHKPHNRKFKKRKVYSSSIDNIWDADVADMQLIIKFNEGIIFCYVLLIFSVNMHGLFH